MNLKQIYCSQNIPSNYLVAKVFKGSALKSRSTVIFKITIWIQALMSIPFKKYKKKLSHQPCPLRWFLKDKTCKGNPEIATMWRKKRPCKGLQLSDCDCFHKVAMSDYLTQTFLRNSLEKQLAVNPEYVQLNCKLWGCYLLLLTVT